MAGKLSIVGGDAKTCVGDRPGANRRLRAKATDGVWREFQFDTLDTDLVGGDIVVPCSVRELSGPYD